MNIIEAIQEAMKRDANVVNKRAYRYRSGLVTAHDGIHVGPGKTDPKFLLANIGQVHKEYLLDSDMWDVEEVRIEITRSQFLTSVAEVARQKASDRRIMYQPESEFNHVIQQSVLEYWNRIYSKENK